MKDLPSWSIPVGVLAVASVIYAWVKVREERAANPFADKYLTERGMGMPVIWLYYDNSEVHSRW